MNLADLENMACTIYQRLGVLRTLCLLSTCPFNRETLITIDAHRFMLDHLEDALKKLEKNIVKIKRVLMPLDMIGGELYVPRGLSTDNKALLAQNYEINSDLWSLTAKYCVRFLTQLTRHTGIMDLLGNSDLEPLVVRSCGLLLLSSNPNQAKAISQMAVDKGASHDVRTTMIQSAVEKDCPDLAVLGLGCIGCFAGAQEHGKIANIFNTSEGRIAIKDLIHTIYFLTRWVLLL